MSTSESPTYTVRAGSAPSSSMAASTVSGAGLRRMPGFSPTAVSTRPLKKSRASCAAAVCGLLETMAHFTPAALSSSNSSMMPG